MAGAPSSFDREVLERSHQTPVLVDFWAPWCGPCKMLAPVLDRLAASANGRWALVKVNTDEQQELAGRYGIRGIPNLKLFVRGEVAAELSGALPEPALRQWLDEHLPTPRRDAMARARELLRSGQPAGAARLLAPLAAAEPADAELSVLTARALAFVRPADAEALLSDLPAGSPWQDEAQLVRSFLAAFASLDQRGGHLPDAPLRAAYLRALDDLRRQDFRAAAAGLVDVLLEKPGYDEGRAKAATLALFRHLGLRHPVSEEFSRAFSMAVNV